MSIAYHFGLEGCIFICRCHIWLYTCYRFETFPFYCEQISFHTFNLTKNQYNTIILFQPLLSEQKNRLKEGLTNDQKYNKRPNLVLHIMRIEEYNFFIQ